MSNFLSIKRIFAIEPPLETVAQMMEDSNLHVEWGGIFNNNWGDKYPYAPRATFRICHNDRMLFIKYTVDEECVKAEVKKDGGKVWTDSCVEFFISFDDMGYYNFEFSCIGKKLLAFRKTKSKATAAPQEILDKIEVHSTLGTECFAERVGETKWELIVGIPLAAFFEHNFETLEGLFAMANAYKCGDSLSKPHFLSWSPIRTAEPDFHRPEYFGRMRFL